MPQQNGRVERKFATLYGRVQAMLNDAKLMPSLQKKLWAEAANTATLLENHITWNSQDTSTFLQFRGKGEKIVLSTSLHKFGEICICTDHSKSIKSKLSLHGKWCMFLGYAEDHAKGTYRLLNLDTCGLILWRDVAFMNNVYGDWAQVKNPAIIDLWTHHEESDGVIKDNQNNKPSIDKDDECSAPSDKYEHLEEIEDSDSNYKPEDDDDEESNDDTNVNVQKSSSNTRLKNALKKIGYII